MSTILRALQKIENETNADDAGHSGGLHPVNPSHTFNRRLTTLWYQQLGKRFLLVGSGCLFVAMIAFLSVKYLKPSIPAVTSGKVSEGQRALPHSVKSSGQNAHPSDAPPQSGPTRPRSYSPKPTHDPDYRPNRLSREYAEKTTPQETIIRPTRRAEPLLDTERISPEDEGEAYLDEEIYPDEVDSLPAESETEQEPIEILESDPEEVRFAQVEPMRNRQLELQAISWSKTPSERIAVINNQIMHQGQNVKGFKVVYIGPEIVVVEQGGQQWKMVFMSR